MISSTEHPGVLSCIPGRIRLHLPGWKGEHAERIENGLRCIKGVQRAQANRLTGNILIHFDCQTTDEGTLLARVNEALDELPKDGWPADVGRSLLRVGVRGMLGHAVVDSLWFGAGFLGSAMGLPLAGLGPLHVLMDIAVWTMAFSGESQKIRA
jgi:hypothetical protein